MRDETRDWIAAITALVLAAVVMGASAQEMAIRYDRLPAQEELAGELADPLVEAILYSGGVGSGKTYAQCMSQLELSARNYGCTGGLVSPTFGDAEETTIPTLHQILGEEGLNYDFIASRGRQAFLLPWLGGKIDPRTCSKIKIKSAEKPIFGSNWAWAGIDEPGQIREERWLEVGMRLRDRRAKRKVILLTGTPEDIYQVPWLVSNFVDPATRNPAHRVIFASTRDAERYGTVSEGFVSRLEQTLPEKMREAYLEGRFVAFGGAVYFGFSPSAHGVTGTAYREELPILVGLDFNVNPMCGVLAQEQGGRNLVVFDEIRLTDSNTRQWCTEFQRRFPRHVAGVRIYGDPAGRARHTSATETDYTVIREVLGGYRNLTFHIPDAHPDVWDSVLAVNNAFEKGWIVVDRDRCPWLVKDLVQTPKKDGENAIDKTKDKMLTHSSDALRYMVHQLSPSWGAEGVRKIRLGSRLRRMARHSIIPGRRS